MIASLVPRADYASFAECTYLNQASLGLLGQPVVAAMHAFLDAVARHGNQRMSDSQEVSFFEKLRERASQIFHAAPDPFDLDARQVRLANDARRYTLSTMSYISLIGLTEGIDQLLALGESRIESHARSLAERLVESASKQGWQPFRDLSDPAASPHIVSLLRPATEIGMTQDALRRADIVTSSRGGRVRVSLAPYNDESDIASLVAALEAIPAASESRDPRGLN